MMITMEKFDFVVLGGGVSGLGFAKRVSEHGYSVLIIEKENRVGGLSRSLKYKGFHLDFCAHRFFTANKKLLEEILSLPELTMHRHIKKSRIYMFNKYLKYPFEIEDLLRAMPLHQSIGCGVSFLFNLITRSFKDTPSFHSYQDWFVYLYGERLYNIMCFPYTSKIWHTHPSQISADWADQRFQTEKMDRFIKRIIKKIITLDFRNYSLEDDSLAPDGGPFYYPLRGIQDLPNALARTAKKNGTKIECSAKIISVSTRTRTVTYYYKGKEAVVKYDHLISTIPLHTMYWLQERRSKTVETSLKNLKYMDIIFVYVFLNKKRISNDHWIYFPDPDIIFNRAVEFSNWSSYMCPRGKTSICFDISTFEGSAERDMSERELAGRVIDDAHRIKYLDKRDVFDCYVFRVKHAYPFYDLGYKEKLNVIISFLERDHLYLLGRTGKFCYVNSDNSIEMGFNLAERLLQEKTLN